MRPSETSTLGSGRAFPQRPVNCALNWPPSSLTSSQEGCSPSGAFKVRSQRPRNGLASAAPAPHLKTAELQSKPAAIDHGKTKRIAAFMHFNSFYIRVPQVSSNAADETWGCSTAFLDYVSDLMVCEPRPSAPGICGNTIHSPGGRPAPRDARTRYPAPPACASAPPQKTSTGGAADRRNRCRCSVMRLGRRLLSRRADRAPRAIALRMDF